VLDFSRVDGEYGLNECFYGKSRATSLDELGFPRNFSLH